MPNMRAMVISEPHARLRLEERETPEPGPDEVRLRVQACGSCSGASGTRVSSSAKISGVTRACRD